MKEKKLFLVMLVLGLLTIVAAAGVVTIQRGRLPEEENPYIQMEDPGAIIAEETPAESGVQVAGDADASLKAETVPPSAQAMEKENEKAADESGAYAASESVPEPEQPQALAEKETAGSDQAAAPAGTGLDAAVPLVLDFADTGRLKWPVRGNIVLDYSMDQTIYFPTLAQYQCNPAVVIQAEVSDPVAAPANARVAALGTNEEIGNYVVLDLGSDYMATCGQMKDIQVVENEYLEAGQLIGYVAEPTKYYSIEGSNVYFELRHGDKTVDPVDYFE